MPLITDTEIAGVKIYTCPRNDDLRGDLTTVFKAGWTDAPALDQWNLVRSCAGVLRGVHAHSCYDEFYVPIAGRMTLFLKDARRSSATFGAVFQRVISGDDAQAVLVPVGVAHGVFFETEGVLGYGLSNAWTGDNEFGCRWNDPALGAQWPIETPILSERDQIAGSYEHMVAELNTDLADVA